MVIGYGSIVGILGAINFVVLDNYILDQCWSIHYSYYFSLDFIDSREVLGYKTKSDTCLLVEEKFVGAISAIYTNCLVSITLFELSFPDNLRIIAPRMLILLLFAACIFMLTRTRSCFFSPSL